MPPVFARVMRRNAAVRLVGRTQPIADAGLGENVLRLFGIGFDLLPQLAHIDPQILRVGQIVP